MEKTKDQAATYNSNPFTLTFDALGRLFTHNIGWAIALIGLSILGSVSQLVGSFIDFRQDTASTTTVNQSSNFISNLDLSRLITIMIVVGIIVLLIVLTATIVGVFVNGMYAYVALKSEERASVSFHEAFSAVSERFYRLFLATLFANLKIFGWTLLFIIPGIIAAFRYALLPYVIMAADSKERGITSSHESTKQLVKGRLMEVFGISFVGNIIPIVGGLITIVGNAALYRQLKWSSDHNTEKPKVHFLNYTGLILALLLLLFVIFMVTIVILYVASL